MQFSFSWLQFAVADGKITCNGCSFVEAQVAGQDKNNHLGAKLARTSEGARFRYLSHEQTGDTLVVTQESDLLRARTYFTAYADTTAIRIHTEVENSTGEELILEQVSSFVLGLSYSTRQAKEVYLTRFFQSHHAECQPRTHSLFELGFTEVNAGQVRIGQSNIGSWSTKEGLPQGIVQGENGCVTFAIERNNSWNYEISDWNKQFYLYLGGATEAFGGWCKKLQPNEKYETPFVSLCLADTVENSIIEMTKYRRHIAGRSASDEGMPVIFNEYMHLSWDSPTAEGVRAYAPTLAKAGVEYYVIDCGWHDEVPGHIIYPYVGKWVQSDARFPEGVRASTDFIRSLGMKAGLWIEPEIVGKKCREMLDYYGDDCFIQRNGKKVCVMERYFLDFRKEKVVAYMTETIRRMVEEYGAEYIKLDYNQDMGLGCDKQADSAGEGLEVCAKAYLAWIDSVRALFPTVIFETCSSGGMRMDYETLSHFSIVSTSDQIDYKKYPYIAGNILSAVLPEQAAVWSYPVGSPFITEGAFTTTKEWVEENISTEQVILNMVNSFLGRMHLASHIELLSKEKYDLVVEGIEYYKSLIPAKRTGLPCFPLGFTDFSQKQVVGGFTSGDKTYLAVWNLGGEGELAIPVGGRKQAKIAYPKAAPVEYELTNGVLKVRFTKEYQARFFELEG